MAKTFRKKFISGILFTSLLCSELFNTCSYAVVEITLDGHAFEMRGNRYVRTQDGSTYTINLPADFETNPPQGFALIMTGQRQGNFNIRRNGDQPVNNAVIHHPERPIFENATKAREWVQQNVRILNTSRLSYRDTNTDQEFSFSWRGLLQTPTIGAFNAEADDRTHRTNIFALLTLQTPQPWEQRFLIHTIEHTFSQLTNTTRWYDGTHIRFVIEYTRNPHQNLAQIWETNLPGDKYKIANTSPAGIDGRKTKAIVRSPQFQIPQEGLLIEQRNSSYIYSDGNRNWFLTRLLRGGDEQSYVEVIYKSHQLSLDPRLMGEEGRLLPEGVCKHEGETLQEEYRIIEWKNVRGNLLPPIIGRTDYHPHHPFEVNTVPQGHDIEDVPYFTPLRSIIIENVDISNAVAKMIGKTLARGILKRLSLKGSHMSDAKLDKILEGLGNTYNLELDHLNLGNGSSITLDSHKVSTLVRRFTRLKTLDLTNVLDDAGAKNISDVFAQLLKLRTLYVHIPAGQHTYAIQNVKGPLFGIINGIRFLHYKNFIPADALYVLDKIKLLPNLHTLELRGVEFDSLGQTIRNHIRTERARQAIPLPVVSIRFKNPEDREIHLER